MMKEKEIGKSCSMQYGSGSLKVVTASHRDLHSLEQISTGKSGSV